MTQTSLPSLLAIAFALLTCAAAAAQPADKARAEAERLTAQGARAYQRGEYAVALEHFRRSYEVFPSPNTHSNLGRALIKLGRLPEAMEEFEAFLGDANTASEEARQFALQQKTELAAQLGKLAIDADVDGAEVVVDGRPAGVTPLARARWVAPGAHAVSVTAAGLPPFVEQLQIRGGELRTLHAAFRGSAAIAPPPPSQSDGAAVAPPVETPPAARPIEPRPRAGRFMVNAKLGFSALVFSSAGSLDGPTPIYFTFTAEFGVALCCRRQLYLVVPLSVEFYDSGTGRGSETLVEVPVGVQYDIHLVNALYLPVQLSVGYAAIIDSSTDVAPGGTFHAAVIRPTAGLKYVIAGRGNVGIDLVNLPVYVRFDGGTTFLAYRLMFYGGVIF